MVVVALALILTLAGASIVSAQSGPVGIVKTGQLNLRSGPGPGFSVIGALQIGEEVIMIGRTTDSGWAQVQTANGTTGWASTLYLLSGVPFSTLPAVAQPVPWAFITVGTANMRSGPGLQYPVVMTINGGNYVNIHARNLDSTWIYSSWNGTEGWLGTGVIVSNTPFGSLPTQVPSAATPTPGPGTPTVAPGTGTTGGTGTGTITGYMLPVKEGDTIPALNVYAVNVATGAFVANWWYDECAAGFVCEGEYPGKFPYAIGNVPAGDYVLFAYRYNDARGFWGGYTKNPVCDGPGTAEDHGLVIFHVAPGATVSNINVCDRWDKYKGVVPPEPH